MGCWHGCGTWHGWPSRWDWYGPPVEGPEWFEEAGWPAPRRRYRRERPADAERMAASLEARLDELRDELERVQSALADLRRAGSEREEGSEA